MSPSETIGSLEFDSQRQQQAIALVGRVEALENRIHSSFSADEHKQYFLTDGSRRINGQVIIDNTSTEALLVRKNADGGDILVVNTTGSTVRINNNLGVGVAPNVSTVNVSAFPVDLTAYNIQSFYYPSVVTTGTFYNISLYGSINPSVAATKTNSGYAWGLNFSALGLAGLVGTIATLGGINVAYGILGGAGTVTSCQGIELRPYCTTGTITSRFSLLLNAVSGAGTITNQWAMYVADTALSWWAGTVSALVFTDRTPYYEGDAVSEIKKIKGKAKGDKKEIDHDTLPEFVRVKSKRWVALKKCSVEEEADENNKITKVYEKDEDIPPYNIGNLKSGVDYKEVEVIERDLGGMVSVLTTAVQQLADKVEKIEKAPKN